MRKKILFLLATLLVAHNTFAWGPSITLTVDDLVYILYTCLAITGLAIVLSAITYFVRGKVLNSLAWLFTVLSMFASIPITFTAYGMFSSVIPFICLFLLCHTEERKRPSKPYIGLQVLKTIAILVLLFTTVKQLADAYAPGILAPFWMEVLSVVYFNALLAALLYSMLQRLQKKYSITAQAWQIVLWSLLIGAGTWFADINYIATTNLAVHYQKLSLDYVLFHAPYPNIFVNLACWICTGLIVQRLSIQAAPAQSVVG